MSEYRAVWCKMEVPSSKIYEKRKGSNAVVERKKSISKMERKFYYNQCLTLGLSPGKLMLR